MSQQKVDRYKEEKANRQQLIKKAKRKMRLEVIALAAVLALLVGWFSVAVVHQVKNNAEKKVVSTEVSTTAIEGYMSELSAQLNCTAEE